MERATVLGFLVLWVLPVPVYAGTIYVNGATGNDTWTGLCETWSGGTCGPKATIRAGVIAAVDGDTVVVADGLYTGPGNRDIQVPESTYSAVTIRSANGPSACIIDCEWQGRGFRYMFADAVLDGFTITRGYSEGDRRGHAILIHGGTVRNCIIQGNRGPAIYITCDGSTGVLRDCLIAANMECDSTYPGGGVQVKAYSSPVIAGCRFDGNTATRGGGLFSTGIPSLYGCVFTGNMASRSGGAVYIESLDGAHSVECLFYGNSATWYGGAMYVEDARLDIINCTMTENAAWCGGGIYGVWASDINLDNAVVCGNVADHGHELGLEVLASATICHSDICNDGASVYIAGGAYIDWGDGNIHVPPGFVDPGNDDFRLAADSPCVDVGLNDLLPVDEADIDGDGDVYEPLPLDLAGNPRVSRGTVDMGAYEVPFGDCNCDNSVSWRDIDYFVAAMGSEAAWASMFQPGAPSCLYAICDVDGDGGVSWRDIDPFVAALSTTCQSRCRPHDAESGR